MKRCSAAATKLVSLALAMMALAACAIGKTVPQPKTYLVQPAATPDATAARPPTESVRIGGVRVAASYSGNALVYRVGEVEFVSDPYNQFVTEPGAMFADQIASWLNRAGPFRPVLPPESALPTRYVLDATITELFGDFRPAGAPRAVLAIQFTLLDEGRARPQLLLERLIERRVDLTKATPEALVQGYGVALSSILEELRTGLQVIAKAVPLTP